MEDVQNQRYLANGEGGLEESARTDGLDYESESPAYLKLMPLADSLQELRTPRFWRDVLCEIVVVFFLYFFHMGIAFNFGTPESPSQSIIVIGLGDGIYVFVLIEAFGHIQLAVMNPAVVNYFVLTGKMGIIKGLFYVMAECVGAILGTLLIYNCAPGTVQPNFLPQRVHPDMHPGQGVVVECVITASLVFTMCGALDNRNRKQVYMPGLPIGLAVASGVLTSYHFTRGALNPVASLGPAVVTGIWKNHWVYWAGPMSGGLIATLCYHFFTYDKGVFSKSFAPGEGRSIIGGSRKYRACAVKADDCGTEKIALEKEAQA